MYLLEGRLWYYNVDNVALSYSYIQNGSSICQTLKKKGSKEYLETLGNRNTDLGFALESYMCVKKGNAVMWIKWLKERL